jgi:methionyl-tRNA synthetase
MAIAGRGNGYFQSCKPWEAIKSDSKKAANCLLNCVNLVKVLCIALQPFMPSVCDKLAEQLNLKIAGWEGIEKFDIEPGHPIREPTILFRKIQAQNPSQREAQNPSQRGKELVSVNDLSKLDIRIGNVVKAERVQGSKKLLKLEVELDKKRRTIVAGVAEHYQPEELAGKQVAVIVNLEPAKLMGIKSEGMLLAAVEEGKISLLTADKPVKPGTRVE